MCGSAARGEEQMNFPCHQHCKSRGLPRSFWGGDHLAWVLHVTAGEADYWIRVRSGVIEELSGCFDGSFGAIGLVSVERSKYRVQATTSAVMEI
jgi:hypothetical protein